MSEFQYYNNSNFYNQKIIIFIPVRMNSKRLPGKPLYRINKLPLLHHTYNQVLDNTNNFKNVLVYVISSDQEIVNYCHRVLIPVINTSPIKLNTSINKIYNGTDRCAFTVENYFQNLNKDNIIINVQGDILKVPNDFLTSILECFITDQIYWGTLVTDLCLKDSISNDIVKAYVNPNDNYIDMFYRNIGLDSVDQYNLLLDTKHFYKHIGIYAYKKYFLQQFYNLATSKNETNLSLEQMRGLDNNYKIMSKYTQYNSISIDSFNDIVKYNTDI
jgi:3-deoxy-manno-octulosonate cytidylyltransferase (CMP-KDO synthetase)